MKTFVTMGRGGAGKTSFVALMTKFLIASAKTPLLLVDADPDQNLAEMTGIDIQAEGKNTIAELLSETFISRGGTTVGIAPSARIEREDHGPCPIRRVRRRQVERVALRRIQFTLHVGNDLAGRKLGCHHRRRKDNRGEKHKRIRAHTKLAAPIF